MGKVAPEPLVSQRTHSGRSYWVRNVLASDQGQRRRRRHKPHGKGVPKSTANQEALRRALSLERRAAGRYARPARGSRHRRRGEPRAVRRRPGLRPGHLLRADRRQPGPEAAWRPREMDAAPTASQARRSRGPQGRRTSGIPTRPLSRAGRGRAALAARLDALGAERPHQPAAGVARGRIASSRGYDDDYLTALHGELLRVAPGRVADGGDAPAAPPAPAPRPQESRRPQTFTRRTPVHRTGRRGLRGVLRPGPNGPGRAGPSSRCSRPWLPSPGCASRRTHATWPRCSGAPDPPDRSPDRRGRCGGRPPIRRPMSWPGYLVFAILALFAAYVLWILLASRQLRGRSVVDLAAIYPELANHQGKAAIYCYSTHCGPCRHMTPAIDALRAEHPNVLKLDHRRTPGRGRRLGVQATPTVLLVEDGKVLKALVGAHGLGPSRSSSALPDAPICIRAGYPSLRTGSDAAGASSRLQCRAQPSAPNTTGIEMFKRFLNAIKRTPAVEDQASLLRPRAAIKTQRYGATPADACAT